MAAILRELDERLSQVDRHEAFKGLLREVDDVMLQETQDWLLLMKFVELDAVP